MTVGELMGLLANLHADGVTVKLETEEGNIVEVFGVRVDYEGPEVSEVIIR